MDYLKMSPFVKWAGGKKQLVKRLKERIGHLNEHLMNRVNEAIEISFGLEEE